MKRPSRLSLVILAGGICSIALAFVVVVGPQVFWAIHPHTRRLWFEWIETGGVAWAIGAATFGIVVLVARLNGLWKRTLLVAALVAAAYLGGLAFGLERGERELEYKIDYYEQDRAHTDKVLRKMYRENDKLKDRLGLGPLDPVDK
jgi:hypothetical protein